MSSFRRCDVLSKKNQGIMNMYTQAFKNISEPFEKAFRPYIRLNTLIAHNIQALTEMNVNALRNYSNEGTTTLTALSNVKDLQSLTNFNSQHLQSMAKMTQQCIDDCHRYGEIAKQFKIEVDAILSETTEQARSA
jgi:phasin family protein